MSEITILNSPLQEITMIANQFVDEYMPKANGEFVKIYLYLIRTLQGHRRFELSAAADEFECTESDVMRALRYWEKQKLLTLTCENRKLAAIAFCDFPRQKKAVESIENEEKKVAATVEPREAETAESKKTVAPAEQKSVISDRQEEAAVNLPQKKPLSEDRKKELQENEEVSQFLYIAQQYLGRTLTKTDMDNLLYFYSDLHFSADLIEYLVEYCVSKGSRSARYIETVALSWASEGITTVEAARESTNLYHKNYFTILRALGIKNRNPVAAERKLMDQWLEKMSFSLEVISEACQRTVMQTGQPSFQYADSILKDWHKKGVRHLADIERLDEAHKKRTAAGREKPSGEKKNLHTEYPHRKYDYEGIRRTLLEQ